MDVGFGDQETFDFLGEGLFENFDDILDDSELLEMVDTCVGVAGPLTPPPAAAAAAAAPPAFPSPGTPLTATSEENKICDEMNIPEDWFTNLLDDPNLNIDLPVSAATIDAADDDYIIKDDSLFWSSSPVSVLNHGSSGGGSGSGSGSGSGNGNVESGISTSSSSSSNSVNNETDIVSVCPNAPVIRVIPARARTKRPRPATFAPRIRMAVPDTPPLVEGDTKKKKKKQHYQPLASTSELVPTPVPVRKCLHCGIQKTPQWRLGPMGPKTLCNACGVRYKSGRLFPEYRPAASPTFVPSVHSNSHKKVVEMRIKATEATTTTTTTTTKVSPAVKNCDLLLYIRNMD